jgi:hypothetical protein
VCLLLQWKRGANEDGGDADYAVIESCPVSWPSDPDCPRSMAPALDDGGRIGEFVRFVARSKQ